MAVLGNGINAGAELAPRVPVDDDVCDMHFSHYLSACPDFGAEGIK